MERSQGSSQQRNQPQPLLDVLLELSPLAPHVRSHVASVYRILAALMACSAVAAVMHLRGLLPFNGGILTAFLAMLCAMGVQFLDGNNPSFWMPRRILAFLFAFLKGASVGPLIEIVAPLAPSVVPTALIITFIVFAAFSISGMFFTRRNTMYLGGLLGAGLSMLLLAPLASLLIGGRFFYGMEVYLGLLVFSGYIIYDTQLMIANAEQIIPRGGRLDELNPAIGLYINIFAVFVRIMMILLRNQSNQRSSSRRKNDEDDDNNWKSNRVAFSNRR